MAAQVARKVLEVCGTCAQGVFQMVSNKVTVTVDLFSAFGLGVFLLELEKMKQKQREDIATVQERCAQCEQSKEEVMERISNVVEEQHKLQQQIEAIQRQQRQQQRNSSWGAMFGFGRGGGGGGGDENSQEDTTDEEGAGPSTG